MKARALVTLALVTLTERTRALFSSQGSSSSPGGE